VAVPIPLLNYLKKLFQPGAIGRLPARVKEQRVLILTSNETKAIERLERIGKLEINPDRKVFASLAISAASF
jgi:hypothetical protein